MKQVEDLVQNCLEKGLIPPPDFIHFFSNCSTLGEDQEGLFICGNEIQPFTWSHKKYESFIRAACVTGCGGDGAGFLYLICDPMHEWYGRLAFYIYRHNGKFHTFDNYWSLVMFLE